MPLGDLQCEWSNDWHGEIGLSDETITSLIRVFDKRPLFFEPIFNKLKMDRWVVVKNVCMINFIFKNNHNQWVIFQFLYWVSLQTTNSKTTSPNFYDFFTYGNNLNKLYKSMYFFLFIRRKKSDSLNKKNCKNSLFVISKLDST